MKKNMMYIFGFLSFGIALNINNVVLALDSQMNDAPTYSMELKPASEAFQLTKAIFLPDLKDSELGFNDDKSDISYNPGKKCKDYPYSRENCGNNQSLIDRCPFDGTLFRKCQCDTGHYQFNTSNCSYTGTAHKTDYLLGATRCIGNDKVVHATECLCTAKFKYTDNNSCNDSKKIIDTSSYCRNNGVTRYEKCKCDPNRFPYSYNGSSGGFKNAVKAKCGHEDNFLKCENDSTIYFNCAIPTNYKYSTTSCKSERSDWVVSGASRTFTNGDGKSVTLYTICDCPSSYKSGSQCYTYMTRLGYENSSKPFCYEYGHGKRDGSKAFYGKRCIDMNAGTLYSSKSCTNRAGTVVYSDAASDCLCDRKIYTTVGDRCYEYHKFSRQWCWVCRDRTGTYSYRH